jgi:hypothetical protein
MVLPLAMFALLLSGQRPSLPDSQWLRPYTGLHVRGVDTSTLSGKVMCGYQGWHCAEGDGSGLGWMHYRGRHGFQPGSCNFDLWPDVSELPPQERYPTPFKLANGKTAELPSDDNPATVLRHFRWMKQYGLDGVFVQRFGGELLAKAHRDHFTKVLSTCREGANRNGRAFAVMYDLSGLPKGGTDIVREDWADLQDRMKIADTRAYLRHRGKPLVAVWGMGFNDGRKYTLSECLDLIKFLHDRGCSVMVGVPTYWRTHDRDCVDDPLIDEVCKTADVVSPWAVGRFGNPGAADQYVSNTVVPDMALCRDRGVDYLPVVFPGFTWNNLKPGAPLNQIPRRKGAFLEAQFKALKTAGVKMVYQAMFDEIDEGTAIFKCTNAIPVGESKFADFEGLPSDFYLKLVGKWTRMFHPFL